jgi:hypothetical protein
MDQPLGTAHGDLRDLVDVTSQGGSSDLHYDQPVNLNAGFTGVHLTGHVPNGIRRCPTNKGTAVRIPE